jgi:hypothetical protein
MSSNSMATGNGTTQSEEVSSWAKNVFIVIWLVVSTPLKNISQLGLVFPIYGKVKFMFQTTNQLYV